jgi:hypothetical protein
MFAFCKVSILFTETFCNGYVKNNLLPPESVSYSKLLDPLSGVKLCGFEVAEESVRF